MQPGYLYLETHTEHPGLVRLVLAESPPATEPVRHSSHRVRYLARFSDGAAALMHAHELLRHELVDLGGRLYRTDLPFAIAAVESLDLSHRQLYVDPELGPDTRALIERTRGRLVGRRQTVDRIWTTVGYIVLGLLLLRAVASLL